MDTPNEGPEGGPIDEGPAKPQVPGRQTGRYLLEMVFVLVAYVLGGKVGLAIPFTSGNVSPVWPPAGIALAAMLVVGYRIWPAVAVGAFLVNFFTPIPHVTALGIAAGNTAGPLAGAWMLRRMPRFHPSLTRLRDALQLIVLAALGGTAISATVGTSVLYLGGVRAWSNFGAAWRIWWLGDAMGVLIVSPLLLTASGLASIRPPRQIFHLAGVLLGGVVTCLLIFDPRLGFPAAGDVLAFAVFPFVVWGAIRFQAAGAAAVGFLISAVAVWETAHGFGPFVKSASMENAALLQSFLAVISASGMTLAALTTERAELIREQTAREALEQSEKRYRGIVETANEGIWKLDTELITSFVNRRMAELLGYTVAEMLGKPLWDFVFEDDLEERRADVERCRAGASDQLERRFRRKDGSELWTQVSSSPLLNEDGTFSGALAMVSDVTELRKKREQEIHLRLAREVQQRFYATAISIPGLDVAAATHPTQETGGDYFDFFATADNCAIVGIGDVSGHGFGSALVMALTRAYVRSFAEVESDVGEILTKVNRMLVADLEEESFLTLLLIRLDTRDGSLAYAGAGHLPAGVLLDGSGRADAVLASCGPPLGLFADTRFVRTVLPLAPQQLLLLLTDGITETRASDGTEFGPDRALDYARAHRQDSARQIAEGLCQAALCFAPGSHQLDDLTAVVVKVA